MKILLGGLFLVGFIAVGFVLAKVLIGLQNKQQDFDVESED